MIVANNSEEINGLQDIKSNSISNNVDCKILTSIESTNIEPRVKAMQSLWVPSAGIIDTHGLMSKLEYLSINNNVSFLYNESVNDINIDSNNYIINLNEGEIVSDVVINCAGLWAHKISEMLGVKKYDIDFYKGDYYKCTSLRDLNCLIYPIPTVSSLGILHTLKISLQR